ncbi:MAG: hypothetical protein U1F36_06710 [Planctomycetota bacterium]
MERQIHDYATALTDEAFAIGNHGFATEREFWESGLFKSAVERLRGQQFATQKEKQGFIKMVLAHLKTKGLLIDYSFVGDRERHDWEVDLLRGKEVRDRGQGAASTATTPTSSSVRPADEFVIWSLCQNIGADPQHNAWSGIHTRLSAEIIHRGQQVDGLIIWDMLCGNARKCPKRLALRAALPTLEKRTGCLLRASISSHAGYRIHATTRRRPLETSRTSGCMHYGPLSRAMMMTWSTSASRRA